MPHEQSNQAALEQVTQTAAERLSRAIEDIAASQNMDTADVAGHIMGKTIHQLGLKDAAAQRAFGLAKGARGWAATATKSHSAPKPGASR